MEGFLFMALREMELKIFSGNSNQKLAADMAQRLGTPLGKSEVGTFSDGEIAVSIYESVRGCDVFVVQSTAQPVNNNLMELLIMIDAFRRAAAGRITAVVPYFGYARQDRKSKARDPITAKLVANLIATAGSDRMLTMDLHAPQIQGFFDIPVDHMVGMPILAPYFEKQLAKEKAMKDSMVVMSPDLGSVNRARSFAERLDVPLAIVDKRRPKPNSSEIMNIIGDIKDKDVLIVDDMIDTAGTLCNAAAAIAQRGARSVRAAATHAVLSGPALERIEASPLQEVVVLDTIFLPPEKRIDKIRVLTAAPVLSNAVERIHKEQPVSILFK
jgi:ribose-phosphate pyrophosphokinase